MLSRFLFTCIPSEMYRAKTLDTLMEAMVSDLEDLFRNGLEAASLNQPKLSTLVVLGYMYMQ